MDSATIRVAGINGRGDRIRYGSKLFGFAVAMLFVFQYVGLCRAETIAAFQGEPTSGTSAATVDNASGDYPIVTYILSQPIGVQPAGPNGGFARYVFLAQDSTGSIDFFGNTNATSGYPGIPSPGGLPSGYVPAVGDKISFTAQNRPFNGVSEASPASTSVPVSAISVISHSNPVPYSPVAVTIPDINTGVAPVQSITAHLVTVSGVNIIHAGPTFGSAASNTNQVSMTIVQGNNANNDDTSMLLFFDARNYSTAYTKYFGTTIPDGQVNITGLVQLFGSTSELLPMDIQSYTAPTPTGQVFWKPSGVGGTGNWNNNASPQSWNTAANGSGTQQSFSTTSYAAFGGSSGTVTINSASGVMSNGVQFDTNGYVVNGGTATSALILGSYGPGDTTNNRNTISVTNAGDTATINAPIQGTSGLQKTGLGTLILGSTDTGNNTFTGGVKISSGTLQISSDANLGDSNNYVKLSGGTLKFNEGASASLGSSHGLQGVGGSVDAGAGNTLTINGPVTMQGALGLPTNETVVLTNAFVGLGGATFGSTGTLKIGSSGTGTAFVSGAITDNSTTGATIQAGTLKWGYDPTNANATGGGGSIVVANSGATLNIQGNMDTGAVTAGTRIAVSGAGTVDLPHSQTTAFNKAFQIGSAGVPGPTLNIYGVNNLGGNATDQTFFNSGTINNKSGLLSVGTNVRFSIGGTAAYPTTFAGGDMTFAGNISLFRPSSGTVNISVPTGQTVSFTGGWNTSNTASPSQIGDSGTFANNSGFVVQGGGTFNLSNSSGGNFSLLTVPITANGATVNFNGTDTLANGAQIFQTGSTTVSVTTNLGLNATNNGRITLQAANAFAGGVSPNAATAAPVSVSGGGTVSSGGLNQTFNTLAVNGYGVFDLGSTVAVSTSTFADSSTGGGSLWTASGGVGPLLRISSWVGTPGNHGTEGTIVGPGTTWLTASQLNEVHFTGYTTGAQILGTGELVPISSATVLKLGDINQDLHVNASDIVAMMAALSNLNAYDTTYSFDSAELNDVADVNGDGIVTNADLQALINYEKTGHGSESVPEPASFVLLGAGSALVFIRRARNQRKQS